MNLNINSEVALGIVFLLKHKVHQGPTVSFNSSLSKYTIHKKTQTYLNLLDQDFFGAVSNCTYS